MHVNPTAALARFACRTAFVLAGAASITLASQATFPDRAAADATHQVTGTDGEGLWLHDTPSLHDGLLHVLPEGSTLNVTCWVDGSDVAGNPIWLYVSTETGSGYVSDAYVDTAWSSTQDLTDQGITPCGVEPTDEDAVVDETTTPPDSPIHYEGDVLTNFEGPWPLSYALYDHYMWGEGRAAVVEPGFFSDAPGFEDHIRSMPIGGFGIWKPSFASDLYLAVGTFTVSRETENCWAAYDHYDFNPDKWSNALGYFPFYTYQLGGARPFDVHASGCF